MLLFTGYHISSAMTTDTVPVTAWATGSNDSWHQLKKGFKHLSVEYGAIAEKATKQAANEELLISEEFESFLTLLLAYRVSLWLLLRLVFLI